MCSTVYPINMYAEEGKEREEKEEASVCMATKQLNSEV